MELLYSTKGMAFSDPNRHQVKHYTCSAGVSILAGNGKKETGKRENQIRELHAADLCSELDSNLILCDSQLGEVSIITGLQGTAEFLSSVGKMYRSFGIHKKHSSMVPLPAVSSWLPITSSLQLMRPKGHCKEHHNWPGWNHISQDSLLGSNAFWWYQEVEYQHSIGEWRFLRRFEKLHDWTSGISSCYPSSQTWSRCSCHWLRQRIWQHSKRRPEKNNSVGCPLLHKQEVLLSCIIQFDQILEHLISLTLKCLYRRHLSISQWDFLLDIVN